MIRLDSIYRTNGDVERFAGFDVIMFLWQMLSERQSNVNISHREMPQMVDHVAFVANQPYSNWWIILNEHPKGADPVGSCYITKQNEIGLQIAREHQRRGYGKAALTELLERGRLGRYWRLLANINPENEASIALFASFGFTHIQNTYERRA